MSLVSWFLSGPSKDHLEAVYRILKCIKRKPGKGLLFIKASNRTIEVYSDADWAGSQDDRRSTTGYCSYIWGTWWRGTVRRNKWWHEVALKQNSGISTWDLWRNLVEEADRRTASKVQQNCSYSVWHSVCHCYGWDPVDHDRTKHVEIDIHFISEKIEDEVIFITYVPSKFQNADIFTKALFRPNFS